MMGYRLKVVFTKRGDSRFISHLDLVRLFQRASRRSDLPVTVTKGFSPHLKISISRALKLGLESDGLDAVFYMDRHIAPPEFIRALNGKLPEGVKIIRAEEEKSPACTKRSILM